MRRSDSVLNPVARKLVAGAARQFSAFDKRHRSERLASWGLFEVVALLALTYGGIWLLEERGLVLEVVDALRTNYFVFTKEPLLQMYVYISLETFIIKLGVMALVFFTLWARRESVFKALALRGTKTFNVGPSLLGFSIFSLAVAFFQGFDPLIPNQPTHLFFEESAAIGNTLALFSLVVVAPIAEEIFFRGFIFPALARKGGAILSILVTSVFFALVHVPQMNGEWLWVGIIFLTSLFITWVRVVSGSTSYAILFHALYNAIITLVGFAKYRIDGY